jgi:glycosyltransferase involved in cell wall biosynthesis
MNETKLIAEATGDIEVSVVMPCLNEADTVGICVAKARRSFAEHNIIGEVIVADNGSTDGSTDLARQHGARVVHAAARGYGNALIAGIAAARGRFVIMGDSDDSYDFLEVPKFVAKLRQGYDLVQGCRFPAGGGRIMPGAMPFLHRLLGNPMLSGMARQMFHAPIHDVYCGMRGFTKALYDRLDQRCTGMEFATEMIIKSSLHAVRIAEVPITLHPDGRRSHGSHLRTFRDGWRTVRFFMLYSPRWLFLVPGVVLLLLGLVGYGLALPGRTVFGATLDVHTLLSASMFIFLGYQTILFALFTKIFAIGEGLLPEDSRLARLARIFTLERGILLGLLATIFGLALIGRVAWLWIAADFGALSYPTTMRWIVPGVLLTILGFQTVLASFFLSILAMRRPSAAR